MAKSSDLQQTSVSYYKKAKKVNAGCCDISWLNYEICIIKC